MFRHLIGCTVCSTLANTGLGASVFWTNPTCHETHTHKKKKKHTPQRQRSNDASLSNVKVCMVVFPCKHNNKKTGTALSTTNNLSYIIRKKNTTLYNRAHHISEIQSEDDAYLDPTWFINKT